VFALHICAPVKALKKHFKLVMFAQVNIEAQNINIIAPFNLLEITMATFNIFFNHLEPS